MSAAPAQAATWQRFAVDALADFVVSAEPAHLPDGGAALLRRNGLDSIACAIAALDGETVLAVRDQIEAVGGTPRARLIGGGWSSVDQAALFNSVAVRYVDLLDTYLTPGGLCHPADNFGALLSVAESTAASGAEFLLALAVAYEVQCRFSQSVPVMAHGLNHALQLAMSVAAWVLILWKHSIVLSALKSFLLITKKSGKSTALSTRKRKPRNLKSRPCLRPSSSFQDNLKNWLACHAICSMKSAPKNAR